MSMPHAGAGGAIQEHPLVLVTDDNMQARQLLRRIFEREGFRVEEATDGFVAVEMARALQPDLILMDIQMPGMDGFEAVRILRDEPRTARVPIIVVTAAARDPADVTRGFGLGADDYMVKPFNATELVARASSKIRARRLEDSLQQRTAELETLVQIASTLNQGLTLDSVADSLLASILDHLPSDYAALVIVDQQGLPKLERYHGIPGIPDVQVALLAPGTLLGNALHDGKPLLVADADREISDATVFPGVVCQSGIAAAFQHQGQILGALALGRAESDQFTSGNLRVLVSIAEQAALAIRNAELFTELQNYAQNLESMVEARTAALQAAQAQLMRADKLAALGTLAAGVAHEINNPLQPLLTNLEMAIEDLDAGAPVDRELLDFARHDVQRIKRIVSRLLDFARPAVMELVPTDMNLIIREVMLLTGKQLEHAHVQVDYQPGRIRPVVGSADQLKQVLLNLVVNAMDAMQGGGTLRIATWEAGGFVMTRVQDSGAGIPADHLPQVFDPFFTTKSHGTGLGLAVSHSIIESHGGWIDVDSQPGEYTRFTVCLPAFDESN
jgi:signal transduction histidine kinase